MPIRKMNMADHGCGVEMTEVADANEVPANLDMMTIQCVRMMVGNGDAKRLQQIVNEVTASARAY